MHVSVDIDTQTGGLATEYCPESQVSSRVMIVRPNGEVAESNVQDAQYQRDSLQPCTVHTSAGSGSNSVYTLNDLISLGGLDYLIEGVDYYINPETGEVILSDGKEGEKLNQKRKRKSK